MKQMNQLYYRKKNYNEALPNKLFRNKPFLS